MRDKVELMEWYMVLYDRTRTVEGEESFLRRFLEPVETELRDRGSKSSLKKAVENELDWFLDLDRLQCVETERGWVYREFVKYDGEDTETVEEGEHTDIIEYEVVLKYFVEDRNAFKNLRD